MSTRLNPIDDRRRRIVGAKTPEERAAIIMEDMDKPMELGLEELASVSGGDGLSQEVVIPSTHEEIDVLWDVVEQYANDTAAQSASIDWVLPATCLAFELKLIPWFATIDHNGTAYFVYHSIAEERAKMHHTLDAMQGR